MFSRTSRKAATLLLATAVTLSCAVPSQALWSQPHRASEGPARAEPGAGFVSLLVHLFEMIGGALDPNGAH